MMTFCHNMQDTYNSAICVENVKIDKKCTYEVWWLQWRYLWICKVSLHYLHNWQNYDAFSHGKFAVEMLSKNCL